MKRTNAVAKIAAGVIGMGLAASAAFAALDGRAVNITLPESVSVGDKTLPSGDYQISEVQLGGESVFVFRNDHGDAAAVVAATRTASPSDKESSGVSRKTEVTLSPSEDGTLHLSEMFIEGDSAGYRFTGTR